MKNSLLADEDHSLWWLVLGVRRGLYKARSKELSSYGIKPIEAAVLFAVQSIGHRATPAEIARWLLREPHAVSMLLTNMEKKGLIRKLRDLDRKNLVRVELTEKGHEAYDNAAQAASIHRVMSALSREEREQLRKCLLKLLDEVLEELGMDHKRIFPFRHL